MQLLYALVLALSTVPASTVLAGPTCSRRPKGAANAACTASWGWPGFVKGTNPWGDVLSPAESKALSSALSSACASTASSTASEAASTTLSSVTIVPSSTVIPTVSPSLTTITSQFTLSTSSSKAIVSSPTATRSSSPTSVSVPTSATSVTPSSSSTIHSSSVDVTPSTTSSTIPTTPIKSSVSTSSSAKQTLGSASLEPSADTSSSDIATYLSTHNTVRAQHGASPLSWNDTLADAAQKWANGCVFQHSGGTLGPFGENLAAGTGSYSITDAVQSWTNEASEYDPSNPVPSHFTQVVWKATTQVGCAVQTCSGIFAASYGPAQYYVCEYFPQGNVIGAFA
ncbi:hypothetical protein M0805_004802 [Coniferiporia weirii]|nr:hypothetical protein M0805_004802 [Coniferiporia weirii]